MNMTSSTRSPVIPPQGSSDLHDLDEIRSQEETPPPEVSLGHSIEMQELLEDSSDEKSEEESSSADERNASTIVSQEASDERENISRVFRLSNDRIFRDKLYNPKTFGALRAFIIKEAGLLKVMENDKRVLAVAVSFVVDLERLSNKNDPLMPDLWNILMFRLDAVVKISHSCSDIKSFLKGCLDKIDGR